MAMLSSSSSSNVMLLIFFQQLALFARVHNHLHIINFTMPKILLIYISQCLSSPKWLIFLCKFNMICYCSLSHGTTNPLNIKLSLFQQYCNIHLLTLVLPLSSHPTRSGFPFNTSMFNSSSQISISLENSQSLSYSNISMSSSPSTITWVSSTIC